MVFDESVTLVLMFVVVAIIAGVDVYYRIRTGRLAVPRGLGETAEAMSQSIKAAREIVIAVEQLWQSGQITKDERYEQAFGLLSDMFPGVREEWIETAIEASVYWMKRYIDDMDTEP